MKTSFLVVIILSLTLAATVLAQEVTISDFPLGVGGGVTQEFFTPYKGQLKALADTMSHYPKALMIVTGTADGVTYHAHHDAKNPGLALGRAHTVRNLLVAEFGVDSTRIAIQSADFKEKGGQYRAVLIRVERELFESAVAEIPVPEPQHVEAIPEHSHAYAPVIVRQMGLQFGVGVSSSPYGGIPFGAAALSWRRIIFVEATLGYTFWNSSTTLQSTNFSTRHRISGARLIVYPFESLPIGAVGGWSRIEDISQDYYQYIRLSEGLELGVRATPVSFASVTAIYNPSMQRRFGATRADAKNDQFQISLMLHLTFGGDR